MFDLDGSPISSREEKFVNLAASLRVRDVDATPISAHPDVVLPDTETCACSVSM